MALEKILKNSSGVPTGEYERIAGGTLYADSPIGSIQPYGGADAPAGWMICDGTSLLRASYPELFAVIGTAFGSADSTHFNIPDMRESVPKGAGLTGHTVGAHLDADGLAVGEFIDDRIEDHNHQMDYSGDSTVGIGSYASLVQTQNISSSKANTSYVKNARFGGTTEVKSVGVNYIIKAKMVALPADFMSAVDEAVEEVYGDIIPSGASASNKLVAHQTPYNSFTLNNNSGSQKWYKLGTYMSGHNTARLDLVSARVDGQMFESSVRISGVGANANYVSWVGENGCETSIFAIKVDTNRNLYVQMNSYSAIEIRVYGVFTLDIAEQSSTPSGAGIPLQKLVTESDLPPSIPSVHFHGYGNSSETFDISRLNIQQYHTFEITFRAFYAQSGSVTNVKHVYNAASLANPSLAQEIYNTTGVQPTITFNNDGSKLTSMTITLPGEMNTYDLNVSL